MDIPLRCRTDIETALGEPLTAWLVIAETATGRLITLIPDWVDPNVVSDLTADVAHGLSCSGCEHCT